MQAVASSPLPAAFLPMKQITMGSCLRRAVGLYLARLPWFAVWGLCLAALQLAVGQATEDWARALGGLLVIPTTVGFYAIADRAAHKDRVNVHTLLAGCKRGSAWLLGVLEGVILMAGLVAFIVPVIAAAVLLTWAVPALYLRDLGAFSAISRSFGIARQNLGLTFVIAVTCLVLQVLGTGSFLLGAVAIPLSVCLKTVAFEQLDPRPRLAPVPVL